MTSSLEPTLGTSGDGRTPSAAVMDLHIGLHYAGDNSQMLDSNERSQSVLCEAALCVEYLSCLAGMLGATKLSCSIALLLIRVGRP